MTSSEKPWLQRQAYVLPGRTTHASRPYVHTFRRLGYSLRYLRAFIRVIIVSPEVTWRKTERTIVWGKIRRVIICSVPGLGVHLKRKHRLSGGCTSCGTSCNLLLQCPHWDQVSRLCSIYEDRPMTCRLFPITPSDIRDRDLASSGARCGYSFAPKDSSRVARFVNPADRRREYGEFP